jgi:hypothetical protein
VLPQTILYKYYERKAEEEVAAAYADELVRWVLTIYSFPKVKSAFTRQEDSVWIFWPFLLLQQSVKLIMKASIDGSAYTLFVT